MYTIRRKSPLEEVDFVEKHFRSKEIERMCKWLDEQKLIKEKQMKSRSAVQRKNIRKKVSTK